jgi:hypothetical protein
MLEFAAYRLIHVRGRARAFWSGFLAAGSLAWGFQFHESVNVGMNMTTGEKETIRMPGFALADRALAVWAGYLQAVVSDLERLPATRGLLTRDGALQVVAGTVIVWLPQLLISAVGAFSRRGFVRLAGSSLRHGPVLALSEPAGC